MSKIPVYTSQGFCRFVTHRQTAAEVAGKVLEKNESLWRTAEMQWSAVRGDYWLAYYFLPKDEQVRDWDKRPLGIGRKGIVGVLRVQERIAHG